jgi:hypothetical protein
MRSLLQELSWKERLVLFALLSGLIIGILAFIILPTTTDLFAANPQWGWDFRNNLWSPAYLLLQGKSPYRIDQLFDANSVWLPPAIGVFLPLGALSLDMAIKTWFILNLSVFFGIFVLSSMPAQKPPPLFLLMVLLVLLLFPPLVSHLLLGQYSLWIVLVLLLAARGITRHWSIVLLGGCIALAIPKPQLLLLALPSLCISIIRQQQKNHPSSLLPAGRLLMAAGVGSLIFTLPLWLGYPNWIEGFLWALGRNADWIQPSSLNLFRHLTQNIAFGTVLWAIWGGALFGIAAWLAWRQPCDTALRWSLALTPLVTPYVWSWDFVLLLPVMIHSLWLCQRWLTRILWILGYGIIWWGILQQRLNATNTLASDEHFWWIPYGVLALVVTMNWLNHKLDNPNALQPVEAGF